MCESQVTGGQLLCVRPEGHAGGHVYHCGHGSWVDDKHLD